MLVILSEAKDRTQDIWFNRVTSCDQHSLGEIPRRLRDSG